MDLICLYTYPVALTTHSLKLNMLDCPLKRKSIYLLLKFMAAAMFNCSHGAAILDYVLGYIVCSCLLNAHGKTTLDMSITDFTKTCVLLGDWSFSFTFIQWQSS